MNAPWKSNDVLLFLAQKYGDEGPPAVFFLARLFASLILKCLPLPYYIQSDHSNRTMLLYGKYNRFDPKHSVWWWTEFSPFNPVVEVKHPQSSQLVCDEVKII